MSATQFDLPSVNRYITTNEANGKSVFSTQISEDLPQQIVNGIPFGLAYTSNEFPSQLSEDGDIKRYEANLSTPPGLVISTGTVCRFVDFPPASESPMHRTVSLDYGVVLEGEVELTLDGGETRIMKRGDIAIQRATNHAWKNITPGGGWARMLYVLTPCQPVQIGSEVLGESVEGIDVRASE
jgi:quercetin dioxygenase-like cupin family protein